MKQIEPRRSVSAAFFIPYFGRRAAEMFPEHPAEQFVIGESMAFQYLMDRIFGSEKVTVDEGQPQFILIF